MFVLSAAVDDFGNSFPFAFVVLGGGYSFGLSVFLSCLSCLLSGIHSGRVLSCLVGLILWLVSGSVVVFLLSVFCCLPFKR